MKALFLCNLPSALNSGSHQRLTHLLKAVASAAEVTLVYPITHQVIGPDLAALTPFCTQVRTFAFESLTYQRDPRLRRPIFWLTHKLRYLHPTVPALMQQMRSAEARALVSRVCLQKFDLIWCQRISSIQMLPRPVPSRVIVDLDDLEHRKLWNRLQLRMDPPHMVPLQRFEYLKLKRLERSLSHLSFEFAVCSEVDRKVVANAKSWVIPNGVDLPAMEGATRENPQPTIVFVGFMSYEPNEDAALFFTRDILPLLKREIPDVKFYIVGRDPTPAVRRLHDGQSVFVTGSVPQVTEYLLGASVVVAPIRFGGGTRIKILEAFAHGKAVVSTTPGAEGIEVQSGKHLLLADAPEEFAHSCALLLKNRDLRIQLGEQGRALVRDRYQWTKIENMIADLVLGRVPTQVPEEGSPNSDTAVERLSPANPMRQEGDGKIGAQSGRILGRAPENTQLM